MLVKELWLRNHFVTSHGAFKFADKSKTTFFKAYKVWGCVSSANSVSRQCWHNFWEQNQIWECHPKIWERNSSSHFETWVALKKLKHERNSLALIYVEKYSDITYKYILLNYFLNFLCYSALLMKKMFKNKRKK